MSYLGYPEYKKSDAPWIQEIPKNWNLFRGRRIFKQTRDSAYEGDTQLTASQKYGVLPQTLFMQLENQKVVLALKGTENFKHVDIDDFVISLRSFQGGIEHSKYMGCVSPAYTVLKSQKIIYPDYFAYLLKTQIYIDALQSVTDGIRDGKNISYEQFGEIMMPYPPYDEQQKIADFLNKETLKINNLIEKQEQLILLSTEKRQAFISHSITKGINPKVKLRESGVAWLGEIPEHWKVKKLKFIAEIFASNVDKKTIEGEAPIKLCNYTDVYYNDKITEDLEFMNASATNEQISKFVLRAGDVIITKDSETPDDIGIAALVPKEILGVICGYHLSIVRAKNNVSGPFIKCLFDSDYVKSAWMTLANGVTRYGLGQYSIDNLKVPVPPYEEQLQIVSYLEELTNKIDLLIQKSKNSIELLKEHRASLISAAVTGKIDINQMVSK